MEFKLDQAIEILSRTPGVLRSMLGGLSEPWIHNNYGKDTFNPFDVVAHLIHGDQTDWIVRAKIILEHGEDRTFEPYEMQGIYEVSEGRSVGEMLDMFESLRAQNIAELQAMRLTPDKLALRGIHPALGPVTLEMLIATWVTHDLNHIHQIAKCMAYQYRDTIGPWRGRMGIFR
ncbi:MAG: DinB family protein [Planctomycetota bacterium]